MLKNTPVKSWGIGPPPVSVVKRQPYGRFAKPAEAIKGFPKGIADIEHSSALVILPVEQSDEVVALAK